MHAYKVGRALIGEYTNRHVLASNLILLLQVLTRPHV
jgi:hypothetical protein